MPASASTSPSRPRGASLVAALALLVLVLVGCGSDPKKAPAQSSSSLPGGASVSAPAPSDSRQPTDTPASPSQPTAAPSGIPSSAAASTSSAPKPQPKAAPAPKGPSCAGNPRLPAEVDGSVCATRVTGAKRLPVSHGVGYLAAPSGNIICGIFDDQDGSVGGSRVMCNLLDEGKLLSVDKTGRGQSLPPGDPGDVQPTTVDYDTTVGNGSFACRVQKVGVACWSTASRHGIFLSRAKQVTW